MESSAPASTATDEKSITLNIDNLSTRQFNLFTAAVLFILGIVFLLASGSPSAYLLRYRSSDDCITSIYTTLGYDCAPFNLEKNPILGIEVKELTSSNKFVIIELSPLKVKANQPTSITAQVEISAFTTQNNELKDTLIDREKKALIFDCLNSQDQVCSSQQIINIPELDDKEYYFVVNFLNGQDLNSLISDLQITSVTTNLAFRNYTFAVKLLFFVITLAAYLYESRMLKNLTKNFFCPEQQALHLLTPLLLIVNEPFTKHVFGGSLHVWFSITVFTVFSVLLLRLWLPIISELAGSESSLVDSSSKFVKAYLIVYFAIMWLTFIITSSHLMDNPSSDFSSISGGFFAFLKFLLFLTLFAGISWIGLKMKKIIQRMSDFTERENSFFWFSAFFILCHFYLIFRGSLDPFLYDGAGLILFCGVSTLYIIASDYLYLPTQEGLQNAQHLKKYKNPHAQASYKDLEESSEKPPRKAYENQGESGREFNMGQNNNNNEVGGADQGYPYENKGTEDL